VHCYAFVFLVRYLGARPSTNTAQISRYIGTKPVSAGLNIWYMIIKYASSVGLKPNCYSWWMRSEDFKHWALSYESLDDYSEWNVTVLINCVCSRFVQDSIPAKPEAGESKFIFINSGPCTAQVEQLYGTEIEGFTLKKQEVSIELVVTNCWIHVTNASSRTFRKTMQHRTSVTSIGSICKISEAAFMSFMPIL